MWFALYDVNSSFIAFLDGQEFRNCPFLLFLPPKQSKWGMNRRFQEKNAQNIQTFVLSKRLIRLQPNFAQYKDHQILDEVRPKICPTNPKWWTAAILKKT